MIIVIQDSSRRKEETKEGYYEFGLAGVPTEIANKIIRMMSYGSLRWNSALDMRGESEVGRYTSVEGI